MKEIIKKAFNTHNLKREEIVELLCDERINEELFEAADETRRKFTGDEIHLRGLIEFTNICKRNCLYCGLRRDNKKLERYRLSDDKIIELAKKGAKQGFKTIVLQGGEDKFYSTQKLSEIVKEIKKLDVAITLSVGEMEENDYKLLKEAGADRFLIRIETSNKNLYKKFHPDMDFEKRVACIKNLKKLGFEVGTGVLIGLLGQNAEDLANDILFFKEVEADMIGLGPLIVNKDTPLDGQKDGDLTLALKVMAITRLLMRDINIPATTAMETLHPKGRIMALRAGANVIMPNIGGDEKKMYEIYPGKANVNDETDTSFEKTARMIEEIGRKVGRGYGFRDRKI